MTGPPRTPVGPGAGGAYTAYSYLAAGDFRRFELAPEFGRVAPYAAGLTAEQEQRSHRLLADSIVISRSVDSSPSRASVSTEAEPSRVQPHRPSARRLR